MELALPGALYECIPVGSLTHYPNTGIRCQVRVKVASAQLRRIFAKCDQRNDFK
jgi:hypothetical protein